MSELTHIDEKGAAQMVAIDQKQITRRRAIAHGVVRVQESTLKHIQDGTTPKGDVFSTARIAAVMAAKETSHLIPLCHPLQLTGINVNFAVNQERREISVEACVDALDRTGVEMEALTAVSVACLTLYDMLKAIDHNMFIEGVRVVHKSGGKRDFSLLEKPDQVQAIQADRIENQGVVNSQSQDLAQEQTEVETFSASAGLGRSIKVVGKGNKANSGQETSLIGQEKIEIDKIHFEEVEQTEEDEAAILTSCEKPLVGLLTPIEPITAMNQGQPNIDDIHDQDESDTSIWEESMLAGLNEEDGGVLPTISELAQAHALRVREVSLSYPSLKQFIIERPVECAYLLGYLSPAFTQRCRAFILETDSEDESPVQIQALLFIYSGLTIPTIWTYGSELDIESILFAVHNELPRRIYLNVEAHHYRAIRAYYRLRGKREVLRMGLQKSHYQPIGDTQDVLVLGHRDTGEIMSLFQRYYPDTSLNLLSWNQAFTVV